MSAIGRIDPEMCFHRKIIRAGNEAVGAWIRMIAYAIDRDTRGAISHDEAMAIAPQRVVDKAVSSGLLDRDGEGFRIHDFAEWYPPTDPHISAKRSASGRQGAARRWQTDGNLPSGDGKTDGTLPSGAWQTDGKPHGTLPSVDGKADGTLPSGGRALEGGLGGGLDLKPPKITQDRKLLGSQKLKSARGQPRARVQDRDVGSGSFLKRLPGERDADGDETGPTVARTLPPPMSDPEHRARAEEQKAALERWAAEHGGDK